MSEFSSDKNYYEILSLKEDCSTDEIRKSYKKLALKWHPDKNIDNKEEAEKKFKEISEAYSILSDVSKRKEYDDFKKYGKMGAGLNGFPSNEHQGNFKTTFNYNFDNFDARNVFKEFFGGKDPFADFGKFGFDFDDDFGNLKSSFQNDDFFKGMGTSNFMFNNNDINGSSFHNMGGNGFYNMDFGAESSLKNNVPMKNIGGGKKTSIKKTTQTINGRRVTRIEKTITDENGNTTVEISEEY